MVSNCKQDRQHYLALATLAAKVTTRCAEERPWKKEGKRWETFGEEKAAKAARRKHALYLDGSGHTRCAFRFQFATTEASRKRMSYTECQGPQVERLGVGVGHRLKRSRDEGGGPDSGVLWCSRCGAYAEQALRALAKPCTGQ